MPLLRRLARAALRSALALGGALLLIHGLLALAPGNAADTLALDPAARAAHVQAWGLDGGPAQRLLDSLGALVRGDLGESRVLRPGAPVAELLAEGAPASALLLLGGLGLAWLCARLPPRLLLPLGLLPSFALGALLIEGINRLVLWGLEGGLWSLPGWFALPVEPGLPRWLLAMACLALGAGRALQLAQPGHLAEQAALQSPWALAVQGRAEPLRPHLRRHRALAELGALPALLCALMGGLVLVERVFALPGLGSLFWSAILARELELAAALAGLAALMQTLTAALVELLQARLDPRLAPP